MTTPCLASLAAVEDASTSTPPAEAPPPPEKRRSRRTKRALADERNARKEAGEKMRKDVDGGWPGMLDLFKAEVEAKAA